MSKVTRIIKENYTNFILTVIAIVLLWDGIAIDQNSIILARRLDAINHELSSLSNINSNLADIKFEIKWFSEEVYEK